MVPELFDVFMIFILMLSVAKKLQFGRSKIWKEKKIPL
jgi:hypothetical protein